VYLLGLLKLVLYRLEITRVILGCHTAVGGEDHVAVDDLVGDGAVVGPRDVGQDVARELLAGEGLVEPAFVVIRLQINHQHVELVAERADEGVVALGFHPLYVGEDGMRVDTSASRVAPVEVDEHRLAVEAESFGTDVHLAAFSVAFCLGEGKPGASEREGTKILMDGISHVGEDKRHAHGAPSLPFPCKSPRLAHLLGELPH
jgi:hypothetical protein